MRETASVHRAGGLPRAGGVLDASAVAHTRHVWATDLLHHLRSFFIQTHGGGDIFACSPRRHVLKSPPRQLLILLRKELTWQDTTAFVSKGFFENTGFKRDHLCDIRAHPIFNLRTSPGPTGSCGTCRTSSNPQPIATGWRNIFPCRASANLKS